MVADGKIYVYASINKPGGFYDTAITQPPGLGLSAITDSVSEIELVHCGRRPYITVLVSIQSVATFLSVTVKKLKNDSISLNPL